MTQNNREKFIQIANQYGQILKFYNVEELCAEEIEKIKEFFPNIGVDIHSIAMFYRFFILQLLPQEIEKVIYLDSDIIVNLDINELWQVELGDKPFGAISEFYQIKDKDASIKNQKKYITICREGVVNPEDYFNSGVMLMNLKVLRHEETALSAGMKFISEHPQFRFLDQDILNYCFSTTYLKLPLKFNRFVLRARLENEWAIEKKIYHYATSRICFNLDMNDPYNQMFMDYFIKTPWVDDNTKVALSDNIPSEKHNAISVVIPLYNEEEYIGDCLNSLLVQTFQDFEIIVVDDCSTDNSCAVVESYIPKFGGRLKLAHTEKNSGGGGHVPRNIGLKLTNGDYLYFMDADDMILSTALETFYKAAIFYDAEIVYAASWYFLRAPNDIYLIKDEVSRKMAGVNTEFIIDDPNKNLSRLLFEGSFTDPLTKLGISGNDLAAWTKFVRRDFILRNKILFENIPTSEDIIRTINMYCQAKRFLRISTPLYVHRVYNDNSITRKIRTPQEQCRHCFSAFVAFAKALHKLEKENPILSENPLYCLATLIIHFTRALKLTEDARRELGNEELYKILHSEFVKSSSDSLALLLPFLFSLIDDKRTSSLYYVEPINKFNLHFIARIDIKLLTTSGDLQILSISDPKASVRKPAWLQKNGIGYQIQSYIGELEIVANPTTNGKLNFELKGIDIRKPDDNSKRIPYWIDYTKFTINGKTVFDTLTSTWHDKPYIYTVDAEAGAEIKIRVEWQPNRSDT